MLMHSHGQGANYGYCFWPDLSRRRVAAYRPGFARLGSAIGIARDGFPPGTQAPPWRLPDLAARLHVTPAGDHWQLLVFVNQALVGFPELIDGMYQLAQVAHNLEIVILSSESEADNTITAQGLDLQVPIVIISASPAHLTTAPKAVSPAIAVIVGDCATGAVGNGSHAAAWGNAGKATDIAGTASVLIVPINAPVAVRLSVKAAVRRKTSKLSWHV